MSNMASLMAKCFFILCVISSFISIHGEIKIVRGVEMKLQSFYNPQQDFTCLDGSKTIPFSSVNDDYCDCADASDEPGTSACPEGRYYCYNIGYKPKYLQSSRVNDGLCDCCDGSDEYDSDVACFNECEKFGLQAQAERKEAMAETIEGSKLKNEYIQSGKEKKETKKARIETINGILAQRMQELESAKASKESAETPEREAKEQHDKEWEEQQAKLREEKDQEERVEAFGLLDLDHDGWISMAELQANNHMDADLTELEAKDLLGGETMVDKDGMVNVWKSIKPKYLKAGRPAIDPSKFDESNVNDDNKPDDQGSAEHKEEEEEEKPGESPPPPTHPEDDITQILDEEDEEHDKDLYKSNEHLPEGVDEEDDEDDDDEYPPAANKRKTNEAEKPDYPEATKQLIEAAEKARTHFDEIEKSVKELENEKKDLEDYFGIDFGAHEEFSALKGQCYEYTDREYVYKLCPFESVTQRNKDGGSETGLGNKMTWHGGEPNKYSAMKYEGGQTCWNGPARSTMVNLLCGKENSVTSVSEPSRCEYEMTFKTPALCEEVAQHDEL